MTLAITAARPDELTALAGIERAAAALFPAEDVPPELAGETTPEAELVHALEEGRLWVAREGGGPPLGFALVEELEGHAHLEELDVHPDHGRRGIGRALVEFVCEWARERGDRRITLLTFAHLSWNAPFYASAGFRELAPSEWTPGLRARAEEEARRGLDPGRRVAMARDLAGPGPGARCRRVVRSWPGAWRRRTWRVKRRRAFDSIPRLSSRTCAMPSPTPSSRSP